MKKFILWLGLLMYTTSSLAAAKIIKIYKTVAQGEGEYIGTVMVADTPYGLLIRPDLKGLSLGLHGFHLHQNASCEQFGAAAGDHLDPQHTGKHLGPYTEGGHLGDLPALYVDKEGFANLPVIAPRLRLSDLTGHSLVIHEGGDNYADKPEKMGGGGKRIACGIVE